MPSVRVVMSNGRTYVMPDTTVLEFAHKLGKGQGRWQVCSTPDGDLVINREQVVAVVPADWPR